MTHIRIARMDDIPNLVQYIEMASGGISHFLFDGLIEGMTAAELIEMSLHDENIPLYFENILVAEDKGNIIAATNFYPAKDHKLPEIMNTFIQKEKLSIIAPYLNSRVPDSLYIHTLSVHADYRKTAIGFTLCRKIEKIAQDRGFKSVSAHVWQENQSVLNGLKSAGFIEIEFLDIQHHPSFEYNGGMVLLMKLF